MLLHHHFLGGIRHGAAFLVVLEYFLDIHLEVLANILSVLYTLERGIVVQELEVAILEEVSELNVVCRNAIRMGKYQAVEGRGQDDLARQNVVGKSLDVSSLHGDYVVLATIPFPYLLLVHVMGYYAQLVLLLDWLAGLIQVTEHQPRVAKQYVLVLVLGHPVQVYEPSGNFPTKGDICRVCREVLWMVLRLNSTTHDLVALGDMLVQQHRATKANVHSLPLVLDKLHRALVQLVYQVLVIVVAGVQDVVPIPIGELALVDWYVNSVEVVYLGVELGVLVLGKSLDPLQLVPDCLVPSRYVGIPYDAQIEKVGYVGVLLGISILLEHTHRLQWGHGVEVVLDWVGALARLGQSIVTAPDVGESIERD